MRFIRENTHLTTDSNIVIEHDGKLLSWNIKTYRNFKVEPNTVLDINAYWAGLPKERQDKIFNVYEKIKNAFEEIERTSVLDNTLSTYIAELFEYHPFEEIMRYFNLHAKIKLPPDLKTEYQSNFTVELTYLREDYIELVGFVILMKIMVPIWGEYIATVHEEVGNQFKEYRAAGLLVKSNVSTISAYKRLSMYIDAYWEGYMKSHSGSAILAGLDKGQVPNWLLGNVLVRRISSSELVQSTDPKQEKVIVSYIYNFINNLAENMDKQFGGRINEKGIESASAKDDDGKPSVLENYKIKSEISEGTILTHQVHLINHCFEILQRLDSTCPPEQLEETLMNLSRLPADFQFEEISRTLVKWTLDPIVTARIIEYVDNQALLTAYAVAYTLLRHWGFHTIAMLIFAERTQTNMMSNVARLSITPEQLDKLDVLYPDVINDNRKRQRSRLRRNVATNAILLTLTNYYGAWWKLPVWENPTMYPKLSFTNNVTATPGDIEPMLADLIIFLKTNIHPKLYTFDSKTGSYVINGLVK